MRTLLLALASLCVIASPAAADRFALHYDATTFGLVPIGEMAIDANLSPDGYQIDATLQSGGMLNWFERTHLTANATGAFTNGAVQWTTYDLDHYYSKKHRVIAMHAGADHTVQTQITPTYGVWGTPPTSDEQRRISRDPLSTIMAMAVDVNASRRCAGDYPTFDGRWFYLLELGGGQVDHFSGGGYDGPILKCAIAYIPVAGYERRDRGRIHIPHGEVWFALVPDSSFGPPVRIVTPLAAGGATIRLTDWHHAQVAVGGSDTFTPAPNGAPPQPVPTTPSPSSTTR